MTKNVTIRMDEELLQRVRHRAVDDHVSTSQWITLVLRDAVSADEKQEAACQRALRRLDRGFELGGKPLTREEVYAR